MKVVATMIVVGAVILVGGAAANRAFFGCDKRFPCVYYEGAPTLVVKQ